jgi:hypothetical protein
VDSGDITKAQAERLGNAVGPPLRYFARLRRRMELLGFPPDNSLYVAALKAENAPQEDFVRAHYLSVGGGKGPSAETLDAFAEILAQARDGIAAVPISRTISTSPLRAVIVWRHSKLPGKI